MSITIRPIVSESKIESQYGNSVVKLHVTSVQFYHSVPWSAPAIKSSVGSGFVFSHQGQKYIMTNAHVVSHSKDIQVEMISLSQKFTAQVIHVGHDCDLAILKVENEEFLKLCVPLVWSDENPTPNEKVTLLGFKDGLGLSVTDGVVSRLDFGAYVFSGIALFGGALDVTSTTGSSGGPVFYNDKVIGVLHEGSSGKGRMIPIQIVRHFLTEVFNNPYSEYRGFPEADFAVQRMENAALRAKYGMSGDMTGVLVHDVPALSSAHSHIQRSDVLLEIDSMKITNDGKIRHPDGAGIPISYNHAIRMHRLDENVTFKILRNKTIQEVNVPLTNAILENAIVKHAFGDDLPDYFYRHGIVVQPLSVELTAEKKIAADSVPLMGTYGQEALIMGHVFAAEQTRGYEIFKNRLIYSINGKEVHNMWDALQAFDTHTDVDHVVLDQSRSVMVLPAQTEAEDATLRKKYYVSNRQSDLYSGFILANEMLKHCFFSSAQKDRTEYKPDEIKSSQAMEVKRVSNDNEPKPSKAAAAIYKKYEERSPEQRADEVMSLIMDYARPR